MTSTMLPAPRFALPRGVTNDRRVPAPPERGLSLPARMRTRSDGPRWRVSAVCPPDWGTSLESCGGGFFHTPVGLRFATAPGETRFFEYAHGGGAPMAIAIATIRACRFSTRPRHAAFASWPALRRHAGWLESIGSLRETLREMEIAEAVVDSFDADGDSAEFVEGIATTRSEYRVRLTGTAEELAERCGSTHRRRIRQGERSGWTLRVLSGDAARDAIAAVQDLASARAAQRGDPFDAATPVPEAWSTGHFDDPWGACTVAAYDGDDLLSAAIIGFANGRAFYVTGGSTAGGYHVGAAAWMHWSAMNAFRDAGGTWYNLGGVTSGTEQADDPSSGLHRFKAGFGAERSTRVSARWAIAPGHWRSHAAARWIARRATA